MSYPVKITVEVEVDEETARAGEFLYTYKFDRAMDPESFRDFVMRQALEARFHALRSRMRWAREKVYESPNFRQEEGCSMAEVTDKDGEKHHVMLPNGRFWSAGLRVTEPREGSWNCPKSPTKLCWYDNRKDPVWDFCLFCGGPHERK